MITNVIYGINWGDSWSCLQKAWSQQREISCRHTFSLVRINVRNSALPALGDSEEARALINSLELFMLAGCSLTYAGRCCGVPLCEGTWHRLAADSTGSFQEITRTALEPDHRVGWELRTDSPAVPRLRHGAALTVTGARHGYDDKDTVMLDLSCSVQAHMCKAKTDKQGEHYLGRRSENLWLTGRSLHWTVAWSDWKSPMAAFLLGHTK